MVGYQAMLQMPSSGLRQKYNLILLTAILGLRFWLLNVYPNYDSLKYSFLTETVSCYTVY